MNIDELKKIDGNKFPNDIMDLVFELFSDGEKYKLINKRIGKYFVKHISLDAEKKGPLDYLVTGTVTVEGYDFCFEFESGQSNGTVIRSIELQPDTFDPENTEGYTQIPICTCTHDVINFGCKCGAIKPYKPSY